VGVSRRTLERRFKAATGSGVAAALRAARVQRARQLLLDTDLPLDAVARAAGLGGERQLRMVFAKVLARPPSSFR
jgi:transcriptional regulator GlxA family with amidase domain